MLFPALSVGNIEPMGKKDDDLALPEFADRAWYAYNCLARDKRGELPSYRSLEAADDDMPDAALSKIFSGERSNPEVDTIFAMARVLRTTVEFLRYGKGERPTLSGPLKPRSSVTGTVYYDAAAPRLFPAGLRELEAELLTRKAAGEELLGTEWVELLAEATATASRGEGITRDVARQLVDRQLAKRTGRERAVKSTGPPRSTAPGAKPRKQRRGSPDRPSDRGRSR